MRTGPLLPELCVCITLKIEFANGKTNYLPNITKHLDQVTENFALSGNLSGFLIISLVKSTSIAGQ